MVVGRPTHPGKRIQRHCIAWGSGIGPFPRPRQLTLPDCACLLLSKDQRPLFFEKRYAATYMSALGPNPEVARHWHLGSFRLEPRRLDDRPPPLDIGHVEGGERLRRLLLARDQLVSEASEPLAHDGSASASTSAALSLTTTAFGVPLGETTMSSSRREPRASPPRQLLGRPAPLLDGSWR